MWDSDASDMSFGADGSRLLSESSLMVSESTSSHNDDEQNDLSLSDLSLRDRDDIMSKPFSLLARPEPVTPLQQTSTLGEAEDEGEGHDEASVEHTEKQTGKAREEKLHSDIFILRKLNASFSAFNEAMEATGSINDRIAIQLAQTDALLNKYIEILYRSEDVARLIFDEGWQGAEADEEDIERERAEAIERARREEEERKLALEREKEQREQEERERKEREERERLEQEKRERLAARGGLRGARRAVGTRGVGRVARGTAGSSRQGTTRPPASGLPGRKTTAGGVPRKRQRPDESSGSDGSGSDEIPNSHFPDDGVDISSALAGKKRRLSGHANGSEEEDNPEDFSRFIRESIVRRDTREGTQIVKKIKGKQKVAKGEVGGGSFQSMGLHPSLLRSLTLQGYRVPTPIQRSTIPSLLANPPRDLVGMARTGSGKSLAYMIPLVQRLGGRHSATFGARALILLPTRELALQVLKVGKELSRGWNSTHGDHAGDKEGQNSKGQSLRWGLVVGGEGMDEQFEMITNNPDVIIATPGRLLHLIVEMNLDMKFINYVVFDEADRLFEMGFETALTEIIHRLPPSRQTLLFSATLPKSLVEFAKAGLQDPKLVRLDADSKISSDLKMAFFSVKNAEKDACLLGLLRDVIRVPLAEKKSVDQPEAKDKKKKGKADYSSQATAPHQTLIFAATKHHVEYLSTLLTTIGYSVSHIYGSLDQSARTYQMDQFRKGVTSILVVTDVAARGIDIPVLENVVNYDFPHGGRVFVHRVGRTARAGRQGWAWSFITHNELPYLLDLQLFLARPLTSVVHESGDRAYTESLVLGTFERETIDEDVEYLKSLDNTDHALPTLREVMKRGHAMYERSKGKASPQSYKRAKEMSKDPKWQLAGSDSGIHPVLLRGGDVAEKRKMQDARKVLLKAVNAFTPSETVFEVGNKAGSVNAGLMKQRRKTLQKVAVKAAIRVTEDEDPDTNVEVENDVEMADEEDIASVFKTKGNSFRDDEFYMSHYQKDALTEKGYSLKDGASSFAQQAQGVSFDLTGDDAVQEKKKRQLSWDKKKKKFVKGDGVGADNVKLVKTENGVRLPASYRSGRFEEWKTKNRFSLPRVGEVESQGVGTRNAPGGRKFRHKQTPAAKPLDKFGKDYERKVRQMGRKNAAAEPSEPEKGRKSGRLSRYGGRSLAKVKSELKTSDQIRKKRKTMEHRKAKNARPSKRKHR